jgi:hypothetical protein
MFATSLSMARITPNLILEKASKSFSNMESFILRVKEVGRKNVDFLIGFAKLDISFLFKFLNLMGDNNHRERKNYDFYDFDQKYFTLDNSQAPTRILPYRKLATDLIKAMRRDPSYTHYGSKREIDINNIHSYGCPAIFVRTKDGKQNMIEYTTDIVNNLLNRTVFNNLDKWIRL